MTDRRRHRPPARSARTNRDGHSLFPELVVALDGGRRFQRRQVASADEGLWEVLLQPVPNLEAERFQIGSDAVSHTILARRTALPTRTNGAGHADMFDLSAWLDMPEQPSVTLR